MTLLEMHEEAERRARIDAPPPKWPALTAACTTGFVCALIAMLTLHLAGAPERVGQVSQWVAFLTGVPVGLLFWRQQTKHDRAVERHYQQMRAEAERVQATRN